VSKQSVTDEIAETAQAVAAFGAATATVDGAAAAAFGVNRTDLRIIGILNRDTECTAGQLATECALSPAATTTAIQRLVAAGHATRMIDASDRRRVVVALTPTAQALLITIYGPIGLEGTRQLADYTSAELQLLTGFLRRGEAFQQAQAVRIRLLTAGKK
jgi:DNA-binding MarR family transcriptional regulator